MKINNILQNIIIIIMVCEYKAIKFGIHFGNISYDDVFTLIYTDKHKQDYEYLKLFAKRGDLLINLDIEEFRNYYVYIIDICKDNTILIKNLDETNGYEGFPKVPIDFLDILLINNNFWFNILNTNDDYELDSSSIELSNLSNYNFIFSLNINDIIHNNIILILKKYNISFQLYKQIYKFIENPVYWNIKNTKCYVNKKDISNLIEYIDYKNKNYNLINYKIINDLFYITL
jgi:hypothetical protein